VVAADVGAIAAAARRVGRAAGPATLREATAWLRAAPAPDDAAAGATPYLRLFATTLGGFLLARAMRAAAKAGSADAETRAAAARFFIGQILPPAIGLLPAVTAGAAALASVGEPV
jgi:hypothetical protein